MMLEVLQVRYNTDATSSGGAAGSAGGAGGFGANPAITAASGNFITFTFNYETT